MAAPAKGQTTYVLGREEVERIIRLVRWVEQQQGQQQPDLRRQIPVQGR